MKIDISLFRSKVAQRIFLLFVCCALIPVISLAVISFTHVTGQIKGQSLDRLQKAAKSHGVSIYERFIFLDTDLDTIASALDNWNKTSGISDQPNTFRERLTQRFLNISFFSDSSETISLLGDKKDYSSISNEEREQASNGQSTISINYFSDNVTQVFLIKGVTNNNETGILIGEINPSYLWGIGSKNTLPPMTDLCVVDQWRKIVVSSFPVSSTLLHKLVFGPENQGIRQIEYSQEGEDYIASFWPMFLQSNFFSPNLVIVLRQSKDTIFAPLKYFKTIFPLVVLLSLWIVLFLSIFFIRKSLVPLEKLKEGTERVAHKDFYNPVIVKSNDEFEDLATSFNSMSKQLGQQFNALLNIAEIDRAILSSLDTKEIIETASARISDFFSSDLLTISLANKNEPDTLHTFIYKKNSDEEIADLYTKITTAEKEIQQENAEYLLENLTEDYLGKDLPTYLNPFKENEIPCILILPLFIQDRHAGMIILGYKENVVPSDDDLKHARQLADQFSVALSNANLLEELEDLNWGTLEALARTVDAKSAWTAGHSERVTELAIKMAQIMGCNQKEISTLHRASLLHDIGKIGIPLAILDKPDKLNDEEYGKIKDHPLIGARILKPIKAYEDIIPIVEQHHERYDGNGYPHGLKDDSISIGARILAVADVYDAVTSSRPYREGWVKEKGISLIDRESGTHFDPQVVKAFHVALS